MNEAESEPGRKVLQSVGKTDLGLGTSLAYSPPPLPSWALPASFSPLHQQKHQQPASARASQPCLSLRLDSRSCDMAAISMSSPLNPTITEHDWRFPRRPDDPADCGPDAMTATAPADHPDSHAVSSRINTMASSPFSPSSSSSYHNTAGRSAAAAAVASQPVQAGLRDSLKQLRFDSSRRASVAQGTLFQTDAFAGFQDGLAGMSSSPEDAAKDDPLATQVWRFFAKTKQNLPNHERMENLTWRMMHTTLKKQAHKPEEPAR